MGRRSPLSRNNSSSSSSRKVCLKGLPSHRQILPKCRRCLCRFRCHTYITCTTTTTTTFIIIIIITIHP